MFEPNRAEMGDRQWPEHSPGHKGGLDATRRQIHRIAVLFGLVILSCVVHRGVAAQESNPVPAKSTDSAQSLPNAPADLVAPLRVGHYKRGEA
jgi:hypothetical protein